MFNDDIQGTAATVLAGLYGAMKVRRNIFDHIKYIFYSLLFAIIEVRGDETSALKDQTIVVAGAGSAGSGVLLTIRWNNPLTEDEDE